MDMATISILRTDNIFGEDHMYKPEVCAKLLNILRLGIFNSFGLLKSICVSANAGLLPQCTAQLNS